MEKWQKATEKQIRLSSRTSLGAARLFTEGAIGFSHNIICEQENQTELTRTIPQVFYSVWGTFLLFLLIEIF